MSPNEQYVLEVTDDGHIFRTKINPSTLKAIDEDTFALTAMNICSVYNGVLTTASWGDGSHTTAFTPTHTDFAGLIFMNISLESNSDTETNRKAYKQFQLIHKSSNTDYNWVAPAMTSQYTAGYASDPGLRTWSFVWVCRLQKGVSAFPRIWTGVSNMKFEYTLTAIRLGTDVNSFNA